METAVESMHDYIFLLGSSIETGIFYNLAGGLLKPVCSRPATASACKPYNSPLSCALRGSQRATSRKEHPMDAGALEALISQQIVTAMKAHEPIRTGTLRLIKNALKNKAIEKREPLTDAESQQVLATMIKQRRDSFEQFTQGNRPELAAIEAAEIVVIEEFLPKALDEAGLRALVAEAIAEVAASTGQRPGPKEMGPIMKSVQARLQASGVRAEGRVVSEMVKRELAS
jgi:uncharacterized protein